MDLLNAPLTDSLSPFNGTQTIWFSDAAVIDEYSHMASHNSSLEHS